MITFFILMGKNLLFSQEDPGKIILRDLDPPFKTSEFIKDELLVRFKEGIHTSQITSLNERLGTSIYKIYSFPNGLKIYHLKLNQKKISIQEALQKYKTSPEVVYVTYNYKLYALEPVIPLLSPDDPYFKEQWALENTGQNGGTVDADIDGPEAWEVFTGNNEVVIAVIDTGMQITHPDLASNIWTNPGEIPNNGIDDDGNGYVDDIHGWDFVNEDNSIYDGIDEHATHVAGIIGAIGNNETGIVGVNWHIKIMPLKFLQEGKGETGDALEAFAYAANKGVKIINNSWGRWGAPNPAMEDAIRSSGALCMFAAGNDGFDNDAGYPDSTNYPSSYPLNNIIAVAATDNNDNLVGFGTHFKEKTSSNDIIPPPGPPPPEPPPPSPPPFPGWASNYGRTTVDIGAPGLSIISTVPTDKSNPPYASYSGTSMATPYVTGVAALLKGRFPTKTPLQIKEIILNNVDKKDTLRGLLVTEGRLNAHSSLVSQLSGDRTPPQTSLVTHPLGKLTGNTLTIEASFSWIGLDNITPQEKLVYSYFMEGYDKEWSPWSPAKNITYSLPEGEYTFKVRAKDEAGNFPNEESPLTAKFSLKVFLPIITYPNPCHPDEELKIANIPLSSNIKVYIYNISGELVRTLKEKEIKQEGGSLTAIWDCKNEIGEKVRRGIYIYLIMKGNTTQKTGKIAITKK
ncbi:S8 family serine peptidase [Candidatus Aerophobetes bacterium]|nr:S8 family serine peptidase [Candidatus Aerophobetes bacterium]